MRKAARLKMKMEIKRVITMIHLKFIIKQVGCIDTYKNKRRRPKSDHFWDTFLSFANMPGKLEQRSGMGRLHSCRWVDIRFCAADRDRCFAESAGDQFDFALVCANVPGSVNARNVRLHF
jgi:hypothetical protein